MTGYDLGQNTWGGFAEYARIPARWVVPLPAGLSLRESMIYGTAGFTAAQSVAALVRHGLQPDQGKIVVTAQAAAWESWPWRFSRSWGTKSSLQAENRPRTTC